MRAMLLAIVVVLCSVKEAGAELSYPADRVRDLSIYVAGYRFGFCDLSFTRQYHGYDALTTRLYLGPLGSCRAPFTAIQALVGFCLIALTLLVVLGTFTVRWKKKPVAQ